MLRFVAVVLAVASVSRADDTVSVAVLPYAPLFGDLPQSIGDKSAKLVADELAANKAFKVKDMSGGGKGDDKSAAEEDLATAAKEIGEAMGLFQKAKDLAAAKPPKVKPAADASEKGIQQFLVNFQGADTFKPLSDAYLQLAVARMKLGDDEEVPKLLENLVRIDPNRMLQPGETVPLFIKLHDKARKAFLAKDRGQVKVQSTPAGGRVWLDGRELGETPLLAKDVLPGEHYVKVVKTGQGAFWKKVKVVANEEVSLSADLAGEASGPTAALARALATNSLDESVVEGARKIGKSAKVEFVLVGGLRKEEDNIALKTWAVRVDDGKVVELATLAFDTEMVGAGIEVFKLASDFAEKTKDFPGVALPNAMQVFEGATGQAKDNVQVTEVRVTPGRGDSAPVASNDEGDEGASSGRRRRVVAQATEPVEERRPVVEEKKPDEDAAPVEEAVVRPRIRKRTKIGEEPEVKKPAEDEEKPAETEIKIASSGRKGDVVADAISDEEAEEAAKKAKEVNLDLPKKSRNNELADLSPEELERLRKLEDDKGTGTSAGTIALWTVAGVGGAAIIGTGVYLLFLRPTEPTSAKVRVSWQP